MQKYVYSKMRKYFFDFRSPDKLELYELGLLLKFAIFFKPLREIYTLA